MNKKLLIVAFVAALVSAVGFGGVQRAESAAPFTVSAQGKTTLSVGETNTITVSVETNQIGSLNTIVDVEIYNSGNQRVFQQFFDGQNFVKNQARSYTVAWTPSSAGTYSVRVGVFSANWNNVLSWTDGALAINVTAPAPPQFSSTVSVNPVSPLVSQSLTVTANVKNTGGPVSGTVADIEIYTARGEKVHQQFSENQNFSTNQSQSYSVQWTPNATGTYVVKVGVFASGWSKSFYWTDTAGSFTVAAPVPVVAPAPTPVPTPTTTLLAASAPASPYPVTASTDPASLAANQRGTVTMQLRNNGTTLTNALIDLEIYTESGQRVFQQYWENQNVQVGQTPSYMASWTPSAAGTYTASVGIFTQNWGSLINWNSSAFTLAVTSTPVAQPTAPTAPATGITQIAGNPFYVDPNSQAALEAAKLQSSDPYNAKLLGVIAQSPQAMWFGNWNANITQDVSGYVSGAEKVGKSPILVAYNIPQRDCGGYSAGGANSPDGYKAWIQSFANGIGARAATVILEPDALAGMDCLSSNDRSTRMSLLSYAVNTLKALGKTSVYIDAGHVGWISPANMAPRLQAAGIANANGFALNVSNFYTTAENTQYGQALSSLIGGKHFVIDTSRNGNGANGEWCNPSGRAIGTASTLNTGNTLVDALLWLKRPGESDGNCNGGPSAGVFWKEYAVNLAKSAGY